MSSQCQFGSLWLGMFNLLTKNKLSESVNPPHHLSRGARNLFLFSFFFSNSIPPPLSTPTIVVARRSWEVKIPLYFYYFLPGFRYFFDWANQKNSLLFVFQQTEISQFSRIPRYPVEENQI